jgi:hypothetical protein
MAVVAVASIIVFVMLCVLTPFLERKIDRNAVSYRPSYVDERAPPIALDFQ